LRLAYAQRADAIDQARRAGYSDGEIKKWFRKAQITTDKGDLCKLRRRHL